MVARGMVCEPVYKLLAVLLLLVSAEGSLGREPSAESPTGWYFSKVGCDHDMPAPAESPRRSWEPEHEIDPTTITGYQEMYELTRYPNAEQPTPEQRVRADELVQKCLESAKRHGWFNFEKAKKDGFTLMYSDGTHYVNEAYVLDDRILDPDRPEFLLFYNTLAGKRLAAFMFLTRAPDERGPQIGGPLTVWHRHVWSKPKCLLHKLFVIGDPGPDGHCRAGELAQRSPEMLHVWFVEHPQGPFATDMALSDDIRKQLERPQWP